MHSRNVDSRFDVGSFEPYVVSRHKVVAERVDSARKNPRDYAGVIYRKTLNHFHKFVSFSVEPPIYIGVLYFIILVVLFFRGAFIAAVRALPAARANAFAFCFRADKKDYGKPRRNRYARYDRNCRSVHKKHLTNNYLNLR